MAHEEDSTNSYRIKDIKFFGSARRILLQSANGPCPLLALCNVLLLRNQLSIPQDSRYIGFAELVEMVSNVLFDTNSGGNNGGDSTSSHEANVRENLSSCLEILPRLNVGLDVNCRFSGPTAFEYTQEMTVFDLLDIALYHGWVVSKQDEKAYKTFAHLSYNHVVERLVAFEEAQQRIVDASAKNDQDMGAPTKSNSTEQVVAEATSLLAEGGAPAQAVPEASSSSSAAPGPASTTSADEETRKDIEDGLIIKEFMDRTASQLSYEGLLALHETVRERQLAVFFRNSHFSTMMKYSGELYLLCTDIAFGASHIVWERLDEVDGDTSYCDADFKVNTAGSDEVAALAAAEAVQESDLAAIAAMGRNVEGTTQDERDRLLALQMMEEDLQAEAAQQAQLDALARAQAQHQQAQSATQGVPVAKAAPVARTGCGSSSSGQNGKSKTGKKLAKGIKSCVLQ